MWIGLCVLRSIHHLPIGPSVGLVIVHMEQGLALCKLYLMH